MSGEEARGMGYTRRVNAQTKAGLGALGAAALVAVMGLFLLSDDDGAREPGGARSGPIGKTEPGRDGTPSGVGQGNPVRSQAGAKTRVGKTGSGWTSPGKAPRGPFGHQTRPGRGGPLAVRFRCRDQAGNPLSGVRIEAKRRSGMPLDPVQSDARGEALLPGLPGGESISGLARHPSNRAPVSFGPVTVSKGTVVPLQFTAAAAQGRLRGKIVTDQGHPVSELSKPELVLIDPRDPEGKSILDTHSMSFRGDGSFVAGVAAGRYAVSARGKGLSESDRAYVNVQAGQETGEITLTVRRQGTIGGQVTLPADLQAVKPLALDLVMEVTGGTARNPYTRTVRRPLELDASFRFVLRGCDAGKYRLRLEVPQAGNNRVGPWVRVELSPGGKVSGLNLVLREVMVSVEGTVSDGQGQAIEGATVRVMGRTVSTDRDGRYALRGLNMGSLGIKATKQGFASGYKTANYSGARITVNFVLDALGAVEGKVVAATSPVADVPIVLVSKDENGYLTHNGKTDAQGRYKIANLTPGKYFVKAGAGAKDPYNLAGAPSVTVTSGKTTQAPAVQLP